MQARKRCRGEKGISPINIWTYPLFPPLKDASGASLSGDSQLVTIVEFSATAYRPQTAPFRPWPVPAGEVAGIRRNGDDDGNGTPDYNDLNALSSEDDFIKVDLVHTNAAEVAYRVSRSDTNIKVYSSPDKLNWLTASVSGSLRSGNTDANMAYVEWANASSGTSTLKYSVWDTRHNREALFDAIDFKPFTSVIVYVLGRRQTAGDPNPSPGKQGLVDLAIDEYRKGGRDVYMYDHEDADPFVEGGTAAFQVLNGAITGRGQTNVALIGYSWGGGVINDIARNLSYVLPGQYSLTFTSYVDAIVYGGFGPETTRPTASLYHQNQYEKNGIPFIDPRGAPTEGLLQTDYEIDRSPLGVDHLSIDDALTVKLLIQSELRNKVPR